MNFKTSLLIGAAAVAATSLLAVTSHAKNLRWKMQSTWGSQVAINGESAVYFSNKVKEISDGKVQLRFHEPNALVPSLEVWDAVKNGSVIDSTYSKSTIRLFISCPFAEPCGKTAKVLSENSVVEENSIST